MTPVSIEVRRKRVAQGSRRKRDLIAVAEADAAERRLTPAAESAWAGVVDHLRSEVSLTAFVTWLSELQLVGAQGDTLYIAAPPEKRTWVERRYSRPISEALVGSDFSRVEFSAVGS